MGCRQHNNVDNLLGPRDQTKTLTTPSGHQELIKGTLWVATRWHGCPRAERDGAGAGEGHPPTPNKGESFSAGWGLGDGLLLERGRGRSLSEGI